MSYDVGTHIDLGYINKSNRDSRQVEKKTSLPETSRRLYDVGTKIVFVWADQALKSFQIPIAIA